MPQATFDRYANTAFSAVIGIIVGATCLLAELGAWGAVIVTACWTAHVGCDISAAAHP